VRVSVVIAAWNAKWCIGRALDSVLAGTRVPVEILVCDDGSTDGMAEWIEANYRDPVQVLRLPHRNAAEARVVGLDRARGEWLAFMDADDMWQPAKLECQLDLIARRPELRWLGTDGDLFSDDGVIRASWLSDYFDPVVDMDGDLLTPLLERCYPLLSSMLVERNAYREVGGLNVAYALSYDYDLWIRLALRYPGAILAEPLVRYYTGPHNLSRRYEARHREDQRIMRRLARGDVAAGASVRRRAAERAAALDFDLGLLSLRSGRIREARLRLWRSSSHGPLRRRLLALGGALAPRWSMKRLVRSGWLKSRVARARRVPPARLQAGGESRV
jgi:glycosyltransferase involved in cell wall biosynthesis